MLCIQQRSCAWLACTTHSTQALLRHRDSCDYRSRTKLRNSGRLRSAPQGAWHEPRRGQSSMPRCKPLGSLAPSRCTRCAAVQAPSIPTPTHLGVACIAVFGLLSTLTLTSQLTLISFGQFRLAEQRPGTPLYQKLARDFEARCRADEEETRRKYEEAAAAKRAFTIVSHAALQCLTTSSEEPLL